MKKNPLRKYLLSLPESSRRQAVSDLSKALGVSESYIYAMRCGIKRIPCKYAVKLEKATKKAILREHIFPELHK